MVVRRGDGNEAEFTVVVVHGATPGRAELVVPFSPQRIFGVSEGIKDDTVMPLHCADCDANVWYRWNGRAYEPRLHAVGESIRISGEPGRRSTLFASPRTDANRTGDVPLCARAQVQEVGGEADKRWYRVEVVAPSFPRLGAAAARDGRRGVRGLACPSRADRLLHRREARPGCC